MVAERVDQIESEPVPGRFYLVPCVLNSAWATQWEPVILPVHGDPELGFPQPHYHLDRRFTRWDGCNGDEFENKGDSATVVRADLHPPVEWKRKKCQRRMPDFHFLRAFAAKMERNHEGARLKPGCLVCPHRGVSLANLPVDDEGCVVCPGHGLRWHLESGRLVARVAVRSEVVDE